MKLPQRALPASLDPHMVYVWGPDGRPVKRPRWQVEQERMQIDPMYAKMKQNGIHPVHAAVGGSSGGCGS